MLEIVRRDSIFQKERYTWIINRYEKSENGKIRPPYIESSDETRRHRMLKVVRRERSYYWIYEARAWRNEITAQAGVTFSWFVLDV